jgi:hypothetical protein
MRRFLITMVVAIGLIGEALFVEPQEPTRVANLLRAAARNRRTSEHVPEEMRSHDLHTERSSAVSAPGGRTLRISVYDESHVTELVAATFG